MKIWNDVVNKGCLLLLGKLIKMSGNEQLGEFYMIDGLLCSFGFDFNVFCDGEFVVYIFIDGSCLVVV